MSLRQRTEGFRLDYSHSLARGLVFAGLGQSPGSVRYKDSSSRRNDGVLTNMTPSTDWCWVPELGRWGLRYTTKDTYVAFSRQFSATDRPLTCSFWYKPRVTSIARHWIVSGNTSAAPDFAIGLQREEVDAQYRVALFSGNYTYSGYLLWKGGWQHWSVSWDADDACRFYVDGSLVTSGTRADASAAAGNAMLGRLSTGAAGFLMDGVLCDFTLHVGRALTPAEIAIIANPADPMLGGLIQPPKRRYYGVPHIRPGFRYKIGRLLLQRT